EERRKLASLLPGLLKRLAAGMQIAGTKKVMRKAFLADLMTLHTHVMGSTVTGSAPAEPRVSASPDANVNTVTAERLPPPGSEARADQPPAQRDAPPSEPTAGDQAESDSTSLDFTTVIVNNPFGDGEIRVGEIELSSASDTPTVALKDGDE